MNLRLYVILILTSLCVCLANAQKSGQSIFQTEIIHDVKINFLQSNYYEMMTNNYESTPTGSSVPYIMAHVDIDGVMVDSIGIRFKGFTSYGEGVKKPIKLDFNEFVDGKRFDGLRKLNLNNGTADPALQRDVVAYDLLRSMDVDAPRTSYARVFFNDVYFGFYQVIEQIDKEFLQDNFSNDDGNLYKNLGWSKFEWLGNQASPYQDIFSLKTNKDINDWSGFVNFVDLLNNASDADFKENIKNIFNVDLFLKTLAVDVATNNWDSYLEHGRNWYLYEDLSTGVFHWIPWDYNLSLGGELGFGPVDDGPCELWTDIAVGTNGTNTVRFVNTSFAFGSTTYKWDFGDGNVSTEENVSHEYENPGSYQVCFTITQDEDCNETICEEINTAIDMEACGTLSSPNGPSNFSDAFIATVDFFPECCSVWGNDCEDIYGWFSDSSGGDGFTFSIDQSNNEGVLIKRLLSVPEYFNQYFNHFCDLLENHFVSSYYEDFILSNQTLISDAVQTDPNALFSFDEFIMDSGPEGLTEYIHKRTDLLELELGSSNHTCPDFNPSISFQDIVINEFVASADSAYSVSDISGDYDDWIELFNNTSNQIDLSGIYLSDNQLDLQKWKFPTGSSIDPNEYLIIWADKDESLYELHADFKLSKAGDAIYLSTKSGLIIDEVVFSEQTTNLASARIPNGTGDFVVQEPTFKVNNENVSFAQDENNLLNIKIYPNPVSTILSVDILREEFRSLEYEIYNVSGVKILARTPLTNAINVEALVNGFYTVKIFEDGLTLVNKKFVKLN